MINRKHLAAVPVAALALAALGLGTAAHAAPATVTAVTHVVNRADSGNGGTWAYDNLTRTLKVTPGATSSTYNAVVTDKGTFTTVQGALSPNQATAGTKVTRAVKGTFSGSIKYTVTAAAGSTLTDVATATENDMLAAPAGENTTGNWPDRAFTVKPASVTEGDWSWTYKTAAESWTDSSADGDGNVLADGNITGKVTAPAKAVPYVYAGHVLTVSQDKATVGWSDSKTGWPTASQCVEVYIYGPGFTSPNGGAHVGFTCNNGDQAANIGVLWGLHKGSTYALFVRPATGTYGSHHPIAGTDAKGRVDVVTAS